MCFDFIGAVGSFFSTILICACCFLIGGPILITFGALYLKDESDGLKAFKTAVYDFDATPIQAWTGTINSIPASVRHMSLNVNGVDGATSVFTEATVPLGGTNSSPLLVFTVKINTVQEFTRTVPPGIVEKREFFCPTINCPSSSVDCKCYSTLETFKNECIASGGGYTGGFCGGNSFCAACEQYRHLAGLYLVASEVRPGVYKEDSRLRSAKYDFTELANVYQVQKPSSVVVRLYSDKDPFIALQRLTKGTEVVTYPHWVGILMIALGFLFLLMAISGCGALIFYCVRRKRKPTESSYSRPTTTAPAFTNAAEYVTHNPFVQPPPPPPAQGYVYGEPLQTAQGYVYEQPPPLVESTRNSGDTNAAT